MAAGVGATAGRGSAARRRYPFAFKPFKPFEAVTPPPGMYDPTLDASQAAANRGLFDLGQDITTQGTRDRVDYGIGVNDINRGADRGLDDTNRNLMLLQRSYAQLAGRQGEAANAAGVLSGGAMLQAAAKRAENLAIDRQPLDTAISRIGEDRTNALGKLALDMAPPDASNPLGGRRWQDRGTQLTRAERENTQFGLDSDAVRAFQATGMGFDPLAGKPKNEHVDPKTGASYRTIVKNGVTIAYDERGKVLWKRKA